MKKVQIQVIGISENKVVSEFLLLLLGETEGDFKFPILIGKAEANAISMKLHAIQSPRPLIYEVMLNCAAEMGIRLQETFIYKIEKEIFCTKLIWRTPTSSFETEIRISDGVAMAIYAGFPIYAAESIFSELSAQMANNNTKTVEEKSMKELNNSELAQLLQKCLDNEDYERAAKIRDELNYRKN